MLTGPNMRDVGTTISALANPWRRAMMEIAAAAPGNAASLGMYLPVKQPTASYHLGVLRQAKLLRCQWCPDGDHFYEPNSARLEYLRIYIDECLLPASYRERRYPPILRDDSEAVLTRLLAGAMD